MDNDFLEPVRITIDPPTEEHFLKIFKVARPGVEISPEMLHSLHQGYLKRLYSIAEQFFPELNKNMGENK